MENFQDRIKVKKFGGSIGIIFPRKIVEDKGLKQGDFVEVSIEKIADLSFLWKKGGDISISTQKLMEEIDEGENE